MQKILKFKICQKNVFFNHKNHINCLKFYYPKNFYFVIIKIIEYSREGIIMRMALSKITIEHITIEHIGFVHHGFGDELPVYLL